MLSLIQADLFKTRKRAIGWVMLGLSALVPICAPILMLNTNPADLQILGAFPNGLATGMSLISSGIGAFLLNIFGAVLVGSEYANDTWKNLLTRHPSRVQFILSKWLIVVWAVVLGTICLSLLSQAADTAVLGVAGLQPSPTMTVGMALTAIGVQMISPLVAGTIGMFGAVLGRSTVAGIIFGLVWTTVDQVLPQLMPAWASGFSFAVANGSLQAAVAAGATDNLLNSLVVVVLYVVVPLVAAALLFRQRDMI